MRTQDRPIVVCGPARSGTTVIQAMLNTHPNIQVAREVPLERFPSLRPLLNEIATYQQKEWTAQRTAEVVRDIWFAVSRPMQVNKPDARRWGMKTPWSELDADLWSPLVKPLYVYAMRRGDRVFQSHVRLGWVSDSPAKLIDRYKRSLRAFEKLRAAGSAHLVQVDLVDGPDERRRMGEEVFAFVGEDPSEDILQLIAAWEERLNQPTSKLGEEPELSDEWLELLAADQEYGELMAAYGY